jgi:hypothetical protein
MGSGCVLVLGHVFPKVRPVILFIAPGDHVRHGTPGATGRFVKRRPASGATGLRDGYRRDLPAESC